MTRRRTLPVGFDAPFHVREAREAGITRNRLHATDLDIPFRGVRKAREVDDSDRDDERNPYLRQAEQRRERIRSFAPLLLPHQHLSHESAAAIWGAPLPLVLDGDAVADLSHVPVHVSTLGSGPLVRTAGVRGHRSRDATTRIVEHEGIRVSDPATTWAELATCLPRDDLVAAGDFFCRRWRPGVSRPHVGKPPLATLDEFRAVIVSGRRVGSPLLREAVDLVREDCWSPRETRLRLILTDAGLPEPALNIDTWDDVGRFLGCVDMAYRELRIAIEYHGLQHGTQYAKDVERMAALRAAGWIVIEVTSELLRRPDEIVRRVRAALRERSTRA